MRGVRVDPAAAADDRLRQPAQIFGRMEAALLGEAERPSRVDARHRRTVHPLDIDADRLAGAIFLLEVGLVLLLGREEIAVDAGEIGIDAFVAADRLDPVHRGDLAVMVSRASSSPRTRISSE
jgi:hypothetical protein